ncbi:hypothetical protein [Stenotrophomonas sp. Br8]|uniref:hypothetical protein n=1 Tax=Stenotrophomonas sp. Br8 TaxID=2759658 RepID=UPI001CC60EA2|nr:hypothetical protein [Stenotrophomonas sp. Br8]
MIEFETVAIPAGSLEVIPFVTEKAEAVSLVILEPTTVPDAETNWVTELLRLPFTVAPVMCMTAPFCTLAKVAELPGLKASVAPSPLAIQDSALSPSLMVALSPGRRILA